MGNKQVKSIVNLSHADLRSFVIRWQITSLCNYRCDFCVQGSREAHLEAAKVESVSIREKIADNLVNYIETKIGKEETVELYLIGGEVTILKDFPDILRKFIDCRFKGRIIVYLTTNLSMGPDYFVSLCEMFRGKRGRTLKISASYYRDFTTPETFCGTVLRLSPYFPLKRWPFRKNVLFSIGIPMIDDESWHVYNEMKKAFDKLRVSVNPIMLRDYNTNLSEEVRTRLEPQNADVGSLLVSFIGGIKRRFMNMAQLGYYLNESDRKFHPQGYYCDAGRNCISVSADGQVWRCPVLSPPESFRMGNIWDEGFSLLSSPAICDADHCSCSYFTKIWHT